MLNIDTVKDIAIDWVKNSTMLTVSRWLSGGSLLDGAWQKTSLFTLLGFTAYQLSTKNFVPGGMSETATSATSDILKFGTMFIVSQLLSGGSLTDTAWIYSTFATLVGFTVYHLLTEKYIKGPALATNSKLAAVIDDWTMWSTMFFVARLISNDSLLDPAWVMSSVGVMLGFTVYELGTSYIIDSIFG